MNTIEFRCTMCHREMEVELIPAPEPGDREKVKFLVPKHRVPEASRTWAKFRRNKLEKPRDRGVDVRRVCPMSEAEVVVVI